MAEKTTQLRKQTGRVHIGRRTIQMSETDKHKLRIMSNPGAQGKSGQVMLQVDAELLDDLATGMAARCYQMRLNIRSRPYATIEEKYMSIRLEQGVKVLCDALHSHRVK